MVQNVEGVLLAQSFLIFRSAEDVERFRSHAGKAVAASRAEPDCLGFAIGTDLTDDRTVRMFGRWRDEAAYAAHQASAHRTALIDAIREIDPFTFNFKLFRPVYGLDGLNLSSSDDIKVLTPEEEARMDAMQRAQQVVQVAMHFASEADVDRYTVGAMHAIKTSRKEPGNLEYGWSRDMDDRRTVRLAERWNNAARMFSHIKSDHGTDLVAFIKREFTLRRVTEGGEEDGALLFYIETPAMEQDLPLDEA